jgi:hypothetical protein
MPNYLSFGGVFPFILFLLMPLGPGSEFGMWIRILEAIECGSGSETLVATKDSSTGEIPVL